MFEARGRKSILGVDFFSYFSSPVEAYPSRQWPICARLLFNALQTLSIEGVITAQRR